MRGKIVGMTEFYFFFGFIPQIILSGIKASVSSHHQSVIALKQRLLSSASVPCTTDIPTSLYWKNNNKSLKYFLLK